MKRIAVVGAGWMARVRTKALQSTGQVEICGVAARRLASAQKFGAEIGCNACFDNLHSLIDTCPDAVLVEVPHEVQDGIVLQLLQQGLHLLIGGSLATSVKAGEQLRQMAQQQRLVVEAGYEARYSPVWEAARQMVTGGELGRIVTVRSIALWAGDPRSWYYNQQISGGMPVTHMTYCFINPVRWLVGDPLFVSAFANRVHHTAPELVNEENIVANLLFEDDVLCSMTAGFVAPPQLPAWSVTFIGTRGAVEVQPDEAGSGALMAYRGAASAGAPERQDFRPNPSGFDLQARAFVAALDGQAECQNTPEHTIGDLQVAEAIVASARDKRTMAL